MNWNYEEYVKRQIHNAVVDTGLKDNEGNDYVFEVCTEQVFVNKEKLTPTTIYVVIKYLSSTNTLNAVEQPIQLLVFCEDNQIQASQIIFGKFVSSNNFKEMFLDGTYVKQDYREPVVLSNFNQTAYGYRTIMYISGTLYIMEHVIDVSNIEIEVDDRKIVDLTADELTEAADYFDVGNPNDELSPRYAIKISELVAKMNSESVVGPIGMYADGGPDSDDLSGRIIVDGIECASFNIITTECVLKDVNANVISTISFVGKEYLIIQFMPQEDDEYSDVDHINGVDYYKVFPSVVTKKIIGYLSIENVKPINFNMVYSMTPNTQPIPPDRIATSVKSLATFALTFAVPLVSTYDFVRVISEIMAGNVSGNKDFVISFNLGNVSFNKIPMKLISTQITTAINQVPGLQIGLIK